ncbi:MAG: hypothetical protein ABJF04_15305 [Reichenbachiella sp.]|uniref:hypothetical protein n=1 Tax=Reichenbachiella sp. TaxID=2184521 RepID=UPI003264C104
MAVKKSTHHHQVTFDFPIKSILPGADENLLLIETADATLKQQTFLLLSFIPLEIVKAIAFGPEYSGLVLKSYTTNSLLFNQYSDQNNPDQSNILSFNWDGGDPTFSLTNTKIIQSGPGWIQIPHPNFTSRKIYLDLDSGTEMKHEPAIVDNIDHLAKIQYAIAYPEASEYFQWFVQYFSTHDIVPCRQIEYLKTDDKFLISFYEESEKGLVNSLAILETDGQMLECILLEDQLTGIGKDTFFVFRNKTIFVTQKNTLNIYDV